MSILPAANTALAATCGAASFSVVRENEETVVVAYQSLEGGGGASSADQVRLGLTDPLISLRDHISQLPRGGRVHFVHHDDEGNAPPESGVAAAAIRGGMVAFRHSLEVELQRRGISVTESGAQDPGLSAPGPSDDHTIDWRGRYVLVTGASSGLGEETALQLAAKGAHVVAVARGESALVALAEKARARGYSGDIYPAPADVTREDSLTNAMTAWTTHHGSERFAALFHCAGSACMGLFERLTDDHVRCAVDLNVAGTLHVFGLLEYLEDGGKLAVVASAGAHFPWGGATVYSAVKRAQHSAAEAVRAQLSKRGISVTSVLAGAFNSPIWSKVGVRFGFDYVMRLARRLLFASSASTAREMIEDVEKRQPYSYPGTGAKFAYRFKNPKGWLARAAGFIYPILFGHS